MREEVEVGGGRKEEGWGGREAERAAGTADRREGVALDGYLCFYRLLITGRRRRRQGRDAAVHAHTHACTPM